MRQRIIGVSALAGVQDGDAYDFLANVAQNDVAVSQIAVGGNIWLSEVNVEDVSFFIIR